MAEEEKRLSIDETLEELQGIVDHLSDDSIPLEDALKAFEEGVKLVRSSNEMLNAMEDKLKVLTENGEIHDI